MWLILCILGFFVHYVSSECQYQGVQYAPGSTVPVTEPCLRCFCAKAGLQCALRVCPTLPDPPPRGCILVHRRKRCCSELVCEDDQVNSNKIEARFEPDTPELPFNETSTSHGCVHAGTWYAAGSAVLTSTRCSLCYCLRGRALCTRPRCLLPAEGCAPVYRPYSCCPTSYKCSAQPHKTSDDGSCLVKGTWYPAGSFVSVSAHGPCDRCYCVRGAVKCTKLHCAPPLPGCLPLIPANECCPGSYNCSGVIEVQPLLNYEKPPELSPEYAKLRNEAHYVPEIIKYPSYIVAESQKSAQKISTPYYFTSTTSSLNIIPTSRQYVATTKQLPLKESPKYSRISLTTTRITEDKQKVTAPIGKLIISPVYKPESTTDYPNEIDGRNNRRIDLETTEYSTELTTETTTFVSTTIDETTTTIPTTELDFDTTTNEILNTTLIQIIGNNSECIEQTETTSLNLEDVTSTVESTISTTTETSTESILTTTVPFKKLPDVLAVNKKDEDYEYDYNLQPNLEIIPFLAADAVDEKKNTGTAYTPHQDSLRETDDSIYPYNLNLFSPPQETEGGFVPRDPPLLDSFYSYQPTSVDPVLNSNPIETNSNCLLFGQEVRHGGLLPSTGPACKKCLCLYGAVVCQPPNCNDLGSPNVAVERMDITESSNIESDPFRDVIRTEAAPDLHSLIDDLHNHQNHQIETEHKKPEEQQNDTFYDTIFQLLGGPTVETTTNKTSSTTSTTQKTPTRQMTTSQPANLESNSILSGPSVTGGSVGLLKLAGCNIYGRMYRVGKIIAELSGPCLQCLCTDTGVQCNALKCGT